MEIRGQLYASDALDPRKEPPVPIKLDGRWAPGTVCKFWRKESLLSLLGMEK
jgi:hypothetical protein